ncbi:PAK4-inhibitor INKA2 [Pelobates fuscus]|uniref:PAK4-inhibitor INKA2 n=1 Tax=Pelobates fuscus TaxID=191477 RepID=UPI002FE4CE82
MDQYIRRLKQELLSMKEVGEDLQEQMNSMMGALQELKLLQVQAALQQLEISGEQNNVYNVEQSQHCQNGWETSEVRHWSSQQAEKSIAGGRSLDNSSLETSRGSSASSSFHSLSVHGTTQGHQVSSKQKETDARHTYSSSILPAAETWKTCEDYEPRLTEDRKGQHLTDGTNIQHDYKKCIDEPFSEEAKDWTSSLMSQSRNRQPLVLGDNIFADLVGNWLDLPELERKCDRNVKLVSSSKSQDIYKKISLTTNFFKKFLRSVRPDRDKLLKEKPGWLQAEEQTIQISKRHKISSKQKGIFYFPSQSDTKGSHGRYEKSGKNNVKGIGYLAKNGQKEPDRVNSGFDMNTVVWV